MLMQFNDVLLTPSELVLVNAKEFIKNLELNVDTLFHMQFNQAFYKDKQPDSVFRKEIYLLDKSTKVSRVELSTAIFIVAILVNVFAGTINLEIKQRNFLFFRSTRLYLFLENNIFEWHSHSLENFILRKMQFGTRRIDFIVADWIEQNSGLILIANKSWDDAIELVKKGMAQRELLTTVQTTYLRIFSHVEYKLPEDSSLLDTQNSVESILGQLKEYKQNNPDIWNLLLREIISGVERSYQG